MGEIFQKNHSAKGPGFEEILASRDGALGFERSAQGLTFQEVSITSKLSKEEI